MVWTGKKIKYKKYRNKVPDKNINKETNNYIIEVVV